MMVKVGRNYQWQGIALRLARWLVIGFAIFQLGIALVGIAKFPAYVSQHPAEFKPNDFWNPEETQLALQTLGWPAQTFGWIDLGSNIFVFAFCYSLGFILLKRKSHDAFSLYLALIFFIMGGLNGAMQVAVLSEVPVLNYFFTDILGATAWQFFFIIFYLFPDGKPVPRWSRWVILGWLLLIVISVTPLENTPVFKSMSGIIGVSFVLFAVGSQVYRHWKHSSPIQVQQTKWVVYWLVVLSAILIPLAPIAFRAPSMETISSDLVFTVVFDFLVIILMSALFVSFMIAILRYRLYDIDRIISRTLVYTLLTGLLGLVYFGSVALLQGVLTTDGRHPTDESAVSSQPSAVMIVGTTLAIAALFNPLRRRLQDFIDRRFYRQKYDAEKALAEFASAARNETELQQLSERLSSTIQATLQPDQLSLWIKQTTNGARNPQATRSIE